MWKSTHRSPARRAIIDLYVSRLFLWTACLYVLYEPPPCTGWMHTRFSWQNEHGEDLLSILSSTSIDIVTSPTSTGTIAKRRERGITTSLSSINSRIPYLQRVRLVCASTSRDRENKVRSLQWCNGLQSWNIHVKQAKT